MNAAALPRAGLLLCCALSAAAQVPQVLMLDDAVRIALAEHPLLRAEALRVNTASGLIQQAGLRPNPRLFVQSENWNFPANPTQAMASVFTDQFLYASQVLETGGKRQSRVELAEQNREITQLERESLARQIEYRVKSAYWAAAGAQRIVELLRENQVNLRQTVEYHEAQLREGAIAEADVIRVRLEGDRGQVALENAEREFAAAQIALLREMGQEDFPEIRLGESWTQPPAPPVADTSQALSRRSEVRLARQAVEQARAGLRLQQANARPDIEVLSGYKRTAGYNTLMWGVQMNLPFFNKNQGNIAAADNEILVAESRLRAVEARVRAEVEAATRDVEIRRQRLASLVTDTLARADDAVSIARAAYREGGTDLLRLLDAERVHIDLEILNARMQMEYRQSIVNLETALGGSQ